MKIRIILMMLVMFIFISISWMHPASANGVLELNEPNEQYDLTPFTKLIRDPEQKLVIYDLFNPETAAAFVDAGHAIPNYGYTDSVYWAKIQLHNYSRQKEWILEIGYPALDSVDLYVVNSSNTIVYKHTGDSYPFKHREVINRNLAFNIVLDKGEEQVLYLRFQTAGSMTLPLQLIHSVHYAEREQTSYLLLGIYIGVMLCMSVYNCVLAFSFRAKAYIYYVLINVTALMLYCTLGGISFQYLWPDAVWWNNRAVVVFICLGYIAAMFFARSYLNMKVRLPKLYQLSHFLIAFEIFNIVLVLIDYLPGLKLSMYSVSFIYMYMVVVGAISLRSGYKPASYFVIGWGIYMICSILSSFTNAGLLPLNNWTMYASQIGSTLEALILSLGLAGRIQSIRREKEQAVEEMKETRKLADSDFLTGLFNRRYVLKMFENISERTNRTTMSLLILDIDHFKKINDTYGHDAGDAVLQQMAAVLTANFRSSDVVGRFGGEEFIMLLPDTRLEQAYRAAENLLRAIRRHQMVIGDITLSCTASIGVAEWKGSDDDNFHHVLRRADEALYHAKKTGRNRICTSES